MKEFINVYLFYLVGKDLDNLIYPGVNNDDIQWRNGYGTVFYAFTPRKDMAKMFMDMRDEKKFQKRVLSMSAEEFHAFNSRYSSYILNDFSYRTEIRDDTKELFRQDSVYILSTENEYNTVNVNGCDQILSMCDDAISTSKISGSNEWLLAAEFIDEILIFQQGGIFKEKYGKALDYILREFMQRLGYYGYGTEDTETEYIDEAQMYIHLFSNTFKEGRQMKCKSLSFIKNQMMK